MKAEGISAVAVFVGGMMLMASVVFSLCWAARADDSAKAERDKAKAKCTEMHAPESCICLWAVPYQREQLCKRKDE